MDALLAVGFFCFGLIMGSFFNVVLYRHGGGTLLGRSQCLSCGHTLHALDLVPLLSYLFLLGRCRFCGSRISLQYPLVEASTGVLYLGVFFLHLPIAATLFFLAVLSFALLITVYDLRHLIIPDSFSYPLIILSLVPLFVSFDPLSFSMAPVSSFFAGPLLAAPLFFLWFFSGGRWMGFGDVKLELSLGWLLGLSQGLAALLIAFWIGAAVGVLLILLSALAARFTRLSSGGAHRTMKSEVPFGPFLIAGLFVVFFFGIDMNGILTLLSYVSY